MLAQWASRVYVRFKEKTTLAINPSSSSSPSPTPPPNFGWSEWNDSYQPIRYYYPLPQLIEFHSCVTKIHSMLIVMSTLILNIQHHLKTFSILQLNHNEIIVFFYIIMSILWSIDCSFQQYYLRGSNGLNRIKNKIDCWHGCLRHIIIIIIT